MDRFQQFMSRTGGYHRFVFGSHDLVVEIEPSETGSGFEVSIDGFPMADILGWSQIVDLVHKMDFEVPKEYSFIPKSSE